MSAEAMSRTGAGPHLPVAGLKKSLLELAPLELDCMRRLWELGEANVRQIRDTLAATRPRAYTTILTIMGRLANKGFVTRRKAGRAFLYFPNLTLEEARLRAIARVVEHFFEGSYDTMASYLSGKGAGLARAGARTQESGAR